MVSVDIATAKRFRALFAGRLDAYGTDAGGCERLPHAVTDHAAAYDHLGRYLMHLTGQRPMGVYPVLPDNTCRWGVVDIDVEDLPLAKNLRRAGSMLGLNIWIERSRSKGYHCWTFAEGWIPAATMRRALLALCQLVDYTPKEVNPKQWSLDEGQLGNYVRLPYPEMGMHGRQIMLDMNGTPLSLGDFLTRVGPVTLLTYEQAGELWTPPAPTRKLQFDSEVSGNVEVLVDKMQRRSRYALAMFTEGPLEGRDRSTFLAHFCHALADQNFEPQETLVLVDALDEKVGKFVGRKDRTEQLQRLVERAYT